MPDLNPHQSYDNSDPKIGREPREIILDIQSGGDQLMAAVQELIEWTDYDISKITDYLKRIGNFLHAVIEAHPKTYALAELCERLSLEEGVLRALLRDVGTQIDIDACDPSETVTEAALIPLLADRAGSRIGDRLAELLRGEGPYLTWR